MIQDTQLEVELIGAAVGHDAFARAATTRGLRPKHLTGDTLPRVLEAVLALHDQDREVDPTLVRGELVRLGTPVDVAGRIVGALPTGETITVGRVLQLTDQVRELASRRRDQQAASQLHQAAEHNDHGARAEALSLLEDADRDRGRAQDAMTAQELADLLGDWIQEPEDQRTADLRLPWPTLQAATNGGIRRGEFVVVAGYSSHGKSLAVDGVLDEALAAGMRCGLYLSEGTHLERGLRLLARHAGTGLTKLRRRTNLISRDFAAITTALNEIEGLPLTVVNAADWSIEEIARDIRRARWDVAAIDHLHDFPYDGERGLSENVRLLRATAKSSTTEHAGTVVICAAQCNDTYAGDGGYPKAPTLRSIKGATAIRQAADVAVLTYLHNDGDGDPGTDGHLHLAKNRNSVLTKADVFLHVARMRLTEPDSTATARSAA